jgi:hypothetical protein
MASLRSNFPSAIRATRQNAPGTLNRKRNHLKVQTHPGEALLSKVITSLFEEEVSVSQERRCSRGGGYRIQAKSYQPVLTSIRFVTVPNHSEARLQMEKRR